MSVCNTYIALIIAALLLSGCADPPYFEEFKTYDGEWSATEPAVFEFSIQDTTRAFDFLLDLRHTEAYPFSNLYLFMQLDFPNGKKSIDTLECVLADERGRWFGRSPGDLVDHRILLNERAIFPLKGDYKITIAQAMRVEPLPEIMDVGFALEEWRQVD